MANKLVALIGAAVIAASALLPSIAAADERHRGGGYDRGRDRGYYDNGYRGDRHYDGRHHGGGYRRDHGDDDNDDAIAAGVIGLVLGAVIGSAITESRQAPPPRYAPPPYDGGGYYDGRQPYYDNGPQLCVRREQTWDPYARRYVTLERRVPC